MKDLLVLIAFSLFAQQPTFRSETKLVIVNLSAKDKSGRPITNLKKEDVEILEDGVRQDIAVFELQQLSGEPLAPVSSGTTAPRTLEERAASSASSGRAVVAPTANNPIRYQDRRLLCLFFDMTSMDPPEQLRAQEAGIKFLQTQMTAADLVEIMTYSTAIKVVQEWTDNRELLIETLRKLNTGEGSDLADIAGTSADEKSWVSRHTHRGFARWCSGGYRRWISRRGHSCRSHQSRRSIGGGPPEVCWEADEGQCHANSCHRHGYDRKRGVRQCHRLAAPAP